MGDYGYTVRIEPPRPSGQVIRVSIDQTFIGDTSHWLTSFEFPDEDCYKFEATLHSVRESIGMLNAELDTTVRADHPPEVVVSNLHDIGRRLTRLLLVKSSKDETNHERTCLVKRLADSDLPILFDFNLPIPVELLTFDFTVGGVGEFTHVLGGRRECWFSNRPPRGKSIGAGLALFHDNQLPSVWKRLIQPAIAHAFEQVEECGSLLDSQKVEAESEIDRLFYGDSAWAHFQCHNEGVRGLRMTRDFFASRDRFDKESRELSAILLNCCHALVRTSADPDRFRVVSSLGDHFSGNIHVPAVIGPYCAVRDGETVAFANALYRELRNHPTIFDAFCEARQRLLETGDFAGILYRFVGSRSLEAPLSKKGGIGTMPMFDAA